MAFEETYQKQADLMVRCLGLLDLGETLALKGGTAINLFYHPMPRLSVDIDLAFIQTGSRDDAFREINGAMGKFRETLAKHGYASSVISSNAEGQQKLIVRGDGVSVKIEPNYTLRGALYPPEERRMVAEAEAYFGREVTFRTLDYREVMAGKISAFLDRQTPRDIFDMGQFLKSVDIPVKSAPHSGGKFTTFSYRKNPKHILSRVADFHQNLAGIISHSIV